VAEAIMEDKGAWRHQNLGIDNPTAM